MAPPLLLLNPLVHLVHLCLPSYCQSPQSLPKRGRLPFSKASALHPHPHDQQWNPLFPRIHLKPSFINEINIVAMHR